MASICEELCSPDIAEAASTESLHRAIATMRLELASRRKRIAGTKGRPETVTTCRIGCGRDKATSAWKMTERWNGLRASGGVCAACCWAARKLDAPRSIEGLLVSGMQQAWFQMCFNAPVILKQCSKVDRTLFSSNKETTFGEAVIDLSNKWTDDATRQRRKRRMRGISPSNVSGKEGGSIESENAFSVPRKHRPQGISTEGIARSTPPRAEQDISKVIPYTQVD